MMAAIRPARVSRDMNRARLGPALLTALCVAAVTRAAGAQVAPPFSAPAHYGAGNDPTSVVVRDVNRDGKPDLVVANPFQNKVSVLPGQGAGVFGAPTSYAAGTFPAAVAVGDFNSDGRLDVVSANQNSSTISILPGLVGGSLGAATNFPTGVGTTPSAIATGDFNRDGKLDVVVGSEFGNAVSVLRNQTPSGGALAFGAATSFGTGTWPRCVVTGDVNGDGKLDLLTSNLASDSVSVLLNQTPDGGVAAFAAAVSYSVAPSPSSVAVADLSGDGKLDLVATGFQSKVTVRLGQAGGVFGAPTNYAVGSEPKSAMVGDVNRDGRPDLIVANFNASSVSVLVGQGGGVFCPAVNSSAGTPAAPTSTAVADVNLDGKLDIVVTNQSSHKASVLLNQGPAFGPLSFGAPTTYPAVSQAISIDAGDFDSDGKLDLAIANSNVDFVSVRRGVGGGLLGPATDYPVFTPEFVTKGDFNRDGKLDLVVANSNVEYASVLLGLGGGAFGAATNNDVGIGPQTIAVADLNGDGILDLAVADYGGFGAVWVLMGQAGGTFAAAVGYPVTGHGVQGIAAGDLNGDGKLDLATSDWTLNLVCVLLGQGGGVFGSALTYPAQDGVNNVTMGDFNQDGRLDLATANYHSNNASVYLNQTPDGGAFSLGAATNYPTGPVAVCVVAADLNGDGKLDLAVSDHHSNTISVLPGQAGGTFGAATAYAVGAKPAYFAVADLNGDGRLDLAAPNFPTAFFSVAMSQGPAPSAWTGLGFGLAGISGIPSLSGAGTLAAGSPGSLTIGNAMPSAPAILFTALASAPAPFKGGTLAAFPFTVTANISMLLSGGLTIPFTWPVGVPPATPLWYQCAVQDAAAPKGVALSNALMAITP